MTKPSYRSILIQNVAPLVDNGEYPVKRRVGDHIKISCEAFRHGHDTIKLIIKYRQKNSSTWLEADMVCTNDGLDTYEGQLLLPEIGLYEYFILGYTDHFENWVADTKKKRAAGENLSSELKVGEKLIHDCQTRANSVNKDHIKTCLVSLKAIKDLNLKTNSMLSDEMLNFISPFADQNGVDTGTSDIYQIRVDRTRAE